MKAETSIPSQPNCRLTNKVAIVTGAGRGIGRAIALTFAEEGADVIVVARTFSEIEQTADLIRSEGGSALAMAADVSDWQAVTAVVDRAQSEFGGIHILVNNAGVQGPIGPLFENDIDSWLQTIQINLVGTFLCCRAVLPAMVQQGFGKIINLSGGGATSPRLNFSAYAASKAAVVRLTENLAEEVRSHNIQVNAIAPGAVNTHMLDEILEAGGIVGESIFKEAERQKEEGGTPPELAAGLAVYLASDASHRLTGKLIAAPHDDWQSWDQDRIDDLNPTPWFTLRRIDAHTLRPLAAILADIGKVLMTSSIRKPIKPNYSSLGTPFRVAIVGCGLIGRRRAEVVCESPSARLMMVVDIDESIARSLGDDMGCPHSTDWNEAVSRNDVDIVIAATPNIYLLPITLAAFENEKHVLCEKPPGRNLSEALCMAEAAEQSGRVLKIGFNHRHHPAICKAHELCLEDKIGSLMFIRAIYGHGGRPGYEKEWRGNAGLAGGGELLDQGVHIVDLCRWFMGDFDEAFGSTSTHYWDLGSFSSDESPSLADRQLEDNAFVLLRRADGRIAQLHTSWTQWKNRFSFEVFGRDGYVRVEGLGGSYGVESLTIGKRRPESGPPNEEYYEFSGPDLSWQAEWDEFISSIHEGRQPLGNGEDGVRAMRIIDAIYESAHSNQIVSL